MISVTAAQDRVLALVATLPAEVVALRQACGRVLAEDARAGRDQPPFAASAMDGYAIADADHHPGSRINVIGEAAAGKGFSGRLMPGEAVRIFTGAPVPDGADRVVLQEDVSRDGDRVTLGAALEEARHIRAAGQDFRAGDSVTAPRRLGPADIALLAAMNLAVVRVTRRPVVALIATGDELVMPGEEPGPDQIIASNGFALAAMAEAEGAAVRVLPIARDDEASLRAVLDLAAGADLVVTIGGASVGDHDLVASVAGAMGLERSFYKVAMRPGKPLMAGRLGGSAMLGLPGNPVSSIVCGHIFMLPMIRRMLGADVVLPTLRRARLTQPLAANGPRAHYMRARLSGGMTAGLPDLNVFDNQDSALLRLLAQADALLVRPVNAPALPAGAEVDFLAI